VPKIISVKQNKRRMFSTDGKELSRVRTRARMPYNELSVRSGLNILITLIAEMFSDEANKENHPRITTEKSS